MVLSVLLCAGAVPLTDDHHQVYQPLPSNIVVASQILRESSSSSQQQQQSQQQQPQSPEYVQYLEHLVDELSCVFANWVQQNPPSSPSSPPTSPSPARLVDMYQQRVTCQRSNSTSSAPHPSSSGLSQLPDLIAHHKKTSSSSGKQQCSTTTTSTPMSSRGDDLRIRRGLAPMRFRLDSVGSTCSVASSTVSSPTSASFAESPTSPSYMTFDLLGGDYSSSTPSSASSTTSFFSDVDDLVDNSHLASTPLSATDFEPSDSLTTDATDAAVDPAADWRRIGRDLRGIADHFASTRSQNTTGCQQSQWTLVSSFLGSPLASAGPIVSALAVYLWWKLVRRIAP